MTRLALSFSSFLVLLAACGGQTVGVDPGGTPPASDDAGADASPVSQSPDSGVLPPVTPPPTSGTDASVPTSCASTADCSGGQECAWSVTENFCIVFNPAGSCVTPVNLPCGAVEEVTGCGCNGQNVTWSTGCVGLPSGWAPVGVAHAGACDDSPPITVDAGGPSPFVPDCTTSSECGPEQVCLNTDPLQVGSGTCVANPCGSSPLSCGCAASLCVGIGPCELSSTGVVECQSEG